MKKFLMIGFFLMNLAASLFFSLNIASSMASTPQTSHSQSLDQIEAIVNEDVITTTELNHAIALAKIQMFQEKVSLPAESALKKQVLAQMVNKKIQLQLAKQAGIETSDKELNQAVKRIAQQNNISVPDLYEHLTREGFVPADYRREMRDQITLHRLQQQEVAAHIHITPEEVKSFMNSNLWQDHSTQEYRLEDLLVPLPETPSPLQIAWAKKEADSLTAKYSKDKSLKELVKTEFHGKATNIQTGDLGWRKLAEIPSIFADKVIHMHPQETAGPIHAPNGFHVIRLTALRSTSPKKTTLTQKQVENLLLQRKFEQNVAQWISRLRSSAYIVINA